MILASLLMSLCKFRNGLGQGRGEDFDVSGCAGAPGQVTQRLREVDGGEPVWATWNHGNHGEEVAEERSKFLTVSNWRTLCHDEKILWKYKQVLGGMELAQSGENGGVVQNTLTTVQANDIC